MATKEMKNSEFKPVECTDTVNCRAERSYQSLAFHDGYVYYEKCLSIPKIDMAN